MPTKVTFAQAAADWLTAREKSGGCRPLTITGYRAAIAKANDQFGGKAVKDVTFADVERLLHAHAHQSKRTSTLTLTVVKSVLRRAVAQGLVSRNVADNDDLKPVGTASTEQAHLSPEGFDKMRAHLVGHRNEFAWLMTLYGARRSEVLGLRWSDLDWDADTVTIARSRTTAPGKRTRKREDRTLVAGPKTERGARTLPLLPDMLAAAKRTRTLRQGEHLAAGVPWDDDAYLCVTEDDRRGPFAPMLPDRYSALWLGLCDAAGVERVTLKAARHGSVTRMRAAGMLDQHVAAWHGHDERIMAAVYTHASTEALREAATDPAKARAKAAQGLRIAAEVVA